MRRGVVLAAAVTAFVVLATLGLVAVVRMFGSIPMPHLPTYACTVGAEVELSAEQAANAATIAAVGIRRGLPRQAVVVALATAWQESELINLTGGDRDSIGLFQQRPSQGWGRPEQIADPRYASNRFYSALLKVKGWQQMRITDAAQAVQHSAHPELYEQHAAKSAVMAAALTGDSGGSVGCTVAGEPPSRGPAAVTALVEGMRLDWGDMPATPDAATVSLGVKTEKAGWQYAHWLVAHATERGVREVTFGGRRWTAEASTWTTSNESPATPPTAVVAELHA